MRSEIKKPCLNVGGAKQGKRETGTGVKLYPLPHIVSQERGFENVL